MKKRLLSAFMALALCLTLLPTAALAEGEDVSISGGVIGGGETTGEGGGIYVAPGSPTEGGGGTYIPGEDTRTEIWCVSKPDSIGRTYDGTTDGSTIPLGMTFTDGTNTYTFTEGTDFTAKKTFDSADAGSHTVTVEIALIGDAAAKYKLKAGEETFTIGGTINKAYPELTVSLSKAACTVGEKLLPLLSISGRQENAAVTYYYAPVNSGYLEFEGTEAVPAIDENTAISEPGTYYVYAKTGETKNYEEERSTTVELTVNEAVVEAASVTKADGTDGGTYESLPAALNAAQDGDTVKLLTNHVTDADALNALGEDFTFEQYASIVPVVTKTLTLDLNHKTVDYLEVGFTETNEETQEKETLATGNLTVTGEAAYGRISNLMFMAGALDIRGGEIGGSGCAGLLCDANSGSVTVSNGTVYGLTVSEGASVTVNGGSNHAGEWVVASGATLNITDGTFGDVQFTCNGTIAISGGSFEKIAVSGASAVSLSALLANGYAFYSTSGAYQSAEGTELSSVRVQKHTHAIGEDGKCTECGAAFGASVTAQGSVSYYDTIDDAFAAAQTNDTVTLLANITNRDGSGIFVSGGPYTLDLNGHRIDAGIDLVVGDMDDSEVLLRGELTVKDSSTDNAGYVQYLKLWNGDLTVESGSFHWIIESTPDSVGTITITGGTAETVTHCSPNVTFRLSGGTFDRISISSTCGENVFPSDLLADGYAYADKNSSAIQNGEGYPTVRDVTVVEHKTHTWDENGVCACGVSCAHSEMNDEGKCSVCGKLLAVASVKTSGGTVTCYRDIHAAFGGAESSSGSTLTLLQDVALPSYDEDKDKDSIYICPDSGDYHFTVDWNGHTLSGNTWRSLLTFSDSISVTLKDSSGSNTGGVCNNGMGAAVYLRIGGSNSVEIRGGTYSPKVTTGERCYGTVRISGGVFNNPKGSGQTTALYVYGGGNLAALLADGFTLARDKGGNSLLDVYSNNLTGHGTFYVVKHTHTIDESTNKCACGYTCSHTAVDENGNCTVCKKPMAAMVTKGGESRAYTDIAAAIAAADGGTVKLLANAGEISIGSPLKLDLNGKTAAKLTVTGDVTLASLLPEGYAFKSGSAWISDLSGTELTTVSMAKIPIKSMNYPTEMSMTYGGAGTLLVKVEKGPDTGAVSFQWYKVEGGKETAVGSATMKNQFDLSAQKLSAGQHTFRFSATCDGYKKMSQDIAVTVQRASISANLITPPTVQENLTYTGQKQALIIAGSVDAQYGEMQYRLGTSGSFSTAIPTGTDAGTYTVWYRVIGDANHNDTAPASVAVHIGQKPLPLTGVTAVSKPYDGTTNAGITSVTFDGVTLNRGTDYTVAASFDDASVGNGKNVTATVTLMGQAAKNYALEQSSFLTTGNITKAAAPDFTKETTLVIVNGHEKTYTVTLPALPTLETPKEYGALTYEIGEIKLNDGYYTSGAKVENGELILPIQKNDVETTGSVGTVTVVIKSTNYEDITLTVNISAKNKLTPVLAGTLTLTPIKITYGEPLSKIKITGTMKAGDTVVEGTFSWQQPGDTILGASTSGHTVGWTFTPKDGNTYTEATGTATVQVDKAQQYGKVSMAGYTYGQAPSTPTLTDRTGDPNAQEVTYRYSAADSGSVQTWDIQNPPALNAGTYRMYASIGDTDNYYGFEAVYCEFVVAKATPTYTAPTGLTAKYGQTLADVTLPVGWSWMDSSESVGGASTAAKTFQAKFTPTDAVNYNTVENIELGVTVNQADGGNLKTVELEQKYTDASDHTYTPDWAGLPAGQDWTFSSEASIVLPKQDFAADGSLLTYAISGGKAGDKITITLKASCNNYEDFTITLTITLTEKDNQQALRITGGTTVVYGETLQLGTSGGNGNGAVTYAVTNGTGEATIDATGKLTPVKVGKVKVSATKAGDASYNSITSSPVEITITRATPTGEPAYTKITASGKTLADAALGIGTITPAGGTIAWDDPTTTEVVANKSYGWTYTPTDTNYTTRTGTIKLWSKSSGGGSGRTVAVVAPDMPMLYRGGTGDAVKTLQEKLNAKGFDSGNVDGIFGAKTYAAVTAFQKANGLGVDGIVGKLTWAKLYDATPVNVTPVTTQPMLRIGSRGDAVRKLQEMLNAKGYTCGSVDGIFGSKTKAAVLAFQKANGLGADGIVGPLTWGKLA